MIQLALALLAVPAAQDLPPGSPHPSYVVWAYYLDEAVDQGHWSEMERPHGLWVALQPRWLPLGDEGARLLSEDGRQDLADFVGARNGWDRSTVRNWERLVRPAAVTLRYGLQAAGGNQPVLAGSEAVIPGVPKVFSDYLRRSVVHDFDVEIAQQSDIADPITGLQFAGNSLAVELLPIPGVGYRAELALVSTRFGQDDPIPTGYHAIDGKDRLRQRISEFAAAIVMVPGVPARLALPGLEGAPFYLDLQIDGPLPPESLQAGNAAMVAVVPGLASREMWSAVVADMELGGDTWSSEDGYLAFAGPEAEALARGAARRAKEAERTVRYELQVEVRGESGAPQTWRLGAQAVANQPLRFAQGELGQALFDWDVEVACTSRIADPVFATLFSGIQGSLAMTDEGQVALELDLRRVEHGNPVMLQLSGERKPMIGHEGAAPGLPGDRVAVERPEEARMHVEGVFQPDSDGVVRIERLSSYFLGGVSTLSVELKVRETP